MPPGVNSIGGFGIMGAANDTTVSQNATWKHKTQRYLLQVEREELIYPWQSLLAEFGGSLGLFLGFSFITIWDSFISLKNYTNLFAV